MERQLTGGEEGGGTAGGGSEIERLPEDFVAHVISLTSPGDASRVAAVSAALRSAAESDAVWERFLPSDWRSIVARAVDPVEFATRKELYLRLSDQPILLVGGTMSFVLERSTGTKCYMVSARMMSIAWGDTPIYWQWIAVPESRFMESAKLLRVYWLAIHGKIESSKLSPRTTYASFLVYKLAHHSYGLGDPFQQASVTLGNSVCQSTVCLELEGPDDPEPDDLQYP